MKFFFTGNMLLWWEWTIGLTLFFYILMDSIKIKMDYNVEMKEFSEFEYEYLKVIKRSCIDVHNFLELWWIVKQNWWKNIS